MSSFLLTLLLLWKPIFFIQCSQLLGGHFHLRLLKTAYLNSGLAIHHFFCELQQQCFGFQKLLKNFICFRSHFFMKTASFTIVGLKKI